MCRDLAFVLPVDVTQPEGMDHSVPVLVPVTTSCLAAPSSIIHSPSIPCLPADGITLFFLACRNENTSIQVKQ